MRIPSLAIVFALGIALHFSCPALAGAGEVVINEIHYHPDSDCEEEEFVELYNPGTGPVDIGGWHFTSGIPFRFPPGTIMGKGDYFVVARDPAALQARFGSIAHVFGPWGVTPGKDEQAKLANDGEDLVLVDAADDVINAVSYDDKTPWPLSPDGGGPSLELICPDLPNDKPGNWRAAGSANPGWTFYQTAGKALDTTLRLYLSLPGSYYIDDIALVPEGGGASLLPNGGFEAAGGWTFAGNHSGSAVVTDQAHGGSACLRIAATGPGGLSDAVRQAVSGLAIDGPRYTLSFWAKRVQAGPRLAVGFEGGGASFDVGENIPGTLKPVGSDAYDAASSSYTLKGAGADVWGTADQFYYLHAPMVGDGFIEADVEWIDCPNTWGKAGLMVRETAAAGSKYAMAILSRDYGVRLQYRSSTGGDCADFAGPSTPGPVKLRLERNGDTLIASADIGDGMAEMSRADIPMAASVLVGLMVNSHQSGSLGTASFSSVTLNGGALRAVTPAEDTISGPIATPGAPNTQMAARTPPSIRKVGNEPQMPGSSDEVSVEAKVDCLDGVQVKSVALEYQLVAPGHYVRIIDPDFQQGWTPVPMHDDGKNGDLHAADTVWTAVVPPQPNRTLVRYRVTATDNAGGVTRLPFADDECPNFAWFVYDGVPDYVADTRSSHGAGYVHPADPLSSMPVYQLITDAADFQDCWGAIGEDYNDNTFRWRGTFVCGAMVYDHIHYRLRGGCWRYYYPKRYMKIKFLPGHHFERADDFGRPDPEKRTKLNLNGIVGNPQAGLGVRGECGIYETLAFSLFGWMGVPSPSSSWVHFRVIRGETEEGTNQYTGDFFGIYLDVEQPDSRFLKSRAMPDGNLYKIENGWTKEANGCNPADDSDIRELTATLPIDTGSAPGPGLNADWLESTIDLDEYFSYHSAVQMADHYDISWGKNFYYYHDPSSGLWSVLPWDVDLTFNTNYGLGGAGVDSWTNPILGTFGLDFKNRLREGMDLLYREDKLFPIIDGWTKMIAEMADADRDRWDDGTIPPYAPLRQRMDELKSWIRGHMAALNAMCADVTIPSTPTIGSPATRAKLAPDALDFTSSAFKGTAGRQQAGSRWIATRVSRFSPAAGTVVRNNLILAGDTWKFLRGKTEPAGASLDWTRPGYDAAAWEEGPSGIGYGDGDLDATTLDDMKDGYRTVYLRHEFQVADPSKLTSLELAIDYDDGFIAYLNGAALTRANAPDRDVVAHDFTDDVVAHEVNGGEVFRVDGDALKLLATGTNVLAIHGFNRALDSGDFTIAPSLVGVTGEGTGGPALPVELLAAENELAPQWDSGLVTGQEASMRIPPEQISTAAGTIYRVRVRYLDSAGRWSHWSAAVEFEMSPPAPASFRRGDANADGEVNIGDPIRILFFLFLGGEAPACAKSADANDDGKVDVADCLVLLEYLFQDAARPADPFAACGPDPTADALPCGSVAVCP